MNATEFKRVFTAAAEGRGDLDQAGSLDGIGCHKERVVCTIGGCAAFLRYQAQYIGGGWDSEELTRTKEVFKRVTLVE